MQELREELIRVNKQLAVYRSIVFKMDSTLRQLKEKIAKVQTGREMFLKDAETKAMQLHVKRKPRVVSEPRGRTESLKFCVEHWRFRVEELRTEQKTWEVWRGLAVYLDDKKNRLELCTRWNRCISCVDRPLQEIARKKKQRACKKIQRFSDLRRDMSLLSQDSDAGLTLTPPPRL